MWMPGGNLDIRREIGPRPDSDGLIGRVQAFDLASHKTLWIKRDRSPHSSAVLATAGGLVFEGTTDRWFRALDDRTGEILWQVRLDAPPSSFPISYSVKGVQYVAVTSGGGNAHDASMTPLMPELTRVEPGVTLWVFRLNRTVSRSVGGCPGGGGALVRRAYNTWISTAANTSVAGRSGCTRAK
jgi:alcohol dehydrogenase (cytochrome c)